MIVISNKLEWKKRLLYFRYLLPWIFLFFSQPIFGQYEEKGIMFWIYRGEDKIGSVVAISIKDGPKQAYRIETHVNVRVVFSFKADIVVRNTFVNEVMTDASARRVLNGTVKINNSITKQSGSYQLINKDQDTTYYKGLINNCVSQLYFKEPVNQTNIFSEAFLEHIPLIKNTAGTYELRMPDGHINHYFYKNGECIEVAIETQLSNVRLVRAPDGSKG